MKTLQSTKGIEIEDLLFIGKTKYEVIGINHSERCVDVICNGTTHLKNIISCFDRHKPMKVTNWKRRIQGK